MNLNILAIIPARGGSKGLPRKNIKQLCGKPLIAYTIEAARESKLTNRIIVSTDDEEIASISKKYGAEIPYFRPKELSDDSSPTIDAILHMINYLEKKEGYNPDYILLLQCTSPLRDSKAIDESISMLVDSEFDALVSVCEAEVNPYWANIFDGDKLKHFIEDGKKITRRQDLPKVYRLNGAIYLIKTEVLKAYKTFEPNSLTGYIMDEYSSIDIDTDLDFKVSELIIKNRGE